MATVPESSLASLASYANIRLWPPPLRRATLLLLLRLLHMHHIHSLGSHVEGGPSLPPRAHAMMTVMTRAALHIDSRRVRPCRIQTCRCRSAGTTSRTASSLLHIHHTHSLGSHIEQGPPPPSPQPRQRTSPCTFTTHHPIRGAGTTKRTASSRCTRPPGTERSAGSGRPRRSVASYDSLCRNCSRSSAHTPAPCYQPVPSYQPTRTPLVMRHTAAQVTG